MNTVKVTAEISEIIDDHAEVCEVYGQGCSYPTKYGVAGLTAILAVQVHYLNEDGKEDWRCFDVQADSDGRTDGIMAYNGLEMTLSDTDEKDNLFDFLQDELGVDEVEFDGSMLDFADVRNKLELVAEQASAEWLADNILDLLKFDEVVDDIKSEVSRRFDDKFCWLFSDDELEELSRACAVKVFEQNVGFDFDDYEPTLDDLLTEILDTVVEHAKELRTIEYKQKTNVHGILSLSSDDELRTMAGNTNRHDELFVNLMERALVRFENAKLDGENRTESGERNWNFGWSGDKSFFIVFAKVTHNIFQPQDTDWRVDTWWFDYKRHRTSLQELCYTEMRLQLSYLS